MIFAIGGLVFWYLIWAGKTQKTRILTKKNFHRFHGISLFLPAPIFNFSSHKIRTQIHRIILKPPTSTTKNQN